MAKLSARSHHTGRRPTLRNNIVEFLKEQDLPVTAYDIAMALGVNKSAPYSPLKDLIGMKLVSKTFGIDGAEFALDKKYYEYLMITEPRRIIG